MVVCGGQDGGLVWGSLPKAASLIVNGLPSTVSLFDRSGAATYCSSAPGHRLFFSPSHICLCVIFSLGHCFISDSSLPCDRVFRVPYSFFPFLVSRFVPPVGVRLCAWSLSPVDVSDISHRSI